MVHYRSITRLISEPLASEINDDEFNPHEEREIDRPITYCETLIHLLKGSLGAGILAMPSGVSKVGIIIGVLVMMFVTVIAAYAIHILIKGQYILCKRLKMGYISYPDSMKLALETGPKMFQPFSKCSRYFVDIVLIIWQLGICCVYVVFTASNLKQVLDLHVTQYSVRMYMVFILVPLIIIDLPKNLKVLAPISTLANLLTFAGLLIVYYYILNIDRKKLTSDLLLNSFKDIPIYVGMALFALEAVGVILALEYNMERPARFVGITGLFNLGMLIIFILYTATGVVGFMKYGYAVEDAITLNLPPKEVTAQVAKLLLTIAVFFSYPLQNYVAYEIIWTNWKKKYKPNVFADYGLRVALVLVPFGVGFAIPFLGPFISLFGAFCLSLLGVVFPCLMDLCIRYPDMYGKARFYLVRDIIIISIGLFALVSGCYSSVVEIIQSFKPKK